MSTSTEGIRTTDPQFECPVTLPTELVGKFPLATASRSTLYQYYYINLYHIVLYNVIPIKYFLWCKFVDKFKELNIYLTNL